MFEHVIIQYSHSMFTKWSIYYPYFFQTERESNVTVLKYHIMFYVYGA